MRRGKSDINLDFMRIILIPILKKMPLWGGPKIEEANLSAHLKWNVNK